MKKEIIRNIISANYYNEFINLIKQGLQEATTGGHSWPHRWPCEGGRLTLCEYIHWEPLFSQILGDKPNLAFEENSHGDIIVSITFSFNVGLENEYIPIPGKKFRVEYWGGDNSPFWGTSGNWERRKVPTKLVTVIFRNVDNNYVLGTVFPGPFKDPGDYSGFDPNKRTEVSCEEILRRKINFRISEHVTSSPLIDSFIKNLKLVDKNGIEHKLIPVEEE